MQNLLAFILRIPSVDSSTPLRTTFLLRLVPVILILKGNLEINLSVRLGTAANMGRLDDPRNRRNIIYSRSVVPDPPTSTPPISFGGEATSSTTLLTLALRPLPMNPGQPRSLSLPRFIMLSHEAYQNHVHDAFALNGGNTTTAAR
ncbi:hypothetical protein EV401DRAFT_2047776 [Pisolithus croceorrhizus]|nr:hypothetical protein EV401DRAFT_2047776 [Pisolithus croceorrhizus]